MNLKETKKELKMAKWNIDFMKSSKDLEELTRNWKEFLGCIERIWKKSERECQVFRNKFEPRQGSTKRLRKIDPLLQYLKNARDANEHSINEIVEEMPGGFSMAPVNRNKPLYIKSMQIKQGELIHYEGDPVKIDFNLSKVEASTFNINGRSFSPPNTHLDKKINEPQNILILAELGIKFYEKYINDIEKKFFIKKE